ncbi:MAG: hypothetical protein E4G74_01460 [Erysipelotrichales bacterium]|nr:MAG: hypothetical protein E4G74_01460 [Erysipelotrichales bacterium]
MILQSKNIEALYEPMDIEIGNESIQAFVALYANLPYALVDVYLPWEATQLILQHNDQLSSDQKTYLQSHTVQVALLDPTKVVFTEESSSEGFRVKGPTTIQEVLDNGMPKTEFERIVGMKVTYTNQTVKEFCIDNGLSFSVVKEALDEFFTNKD